MATHTAPAQRRAGSPAGSPAGGNLQSLLADGAHALVADGDLRTARQCFEAAHRLAERAGDVRATAVAALGLGGLWVHERRTAVDAASLVGRLRHALSLVGPGSSLALQLRARLAAEDDYRVGGHATILAVADEARRAIDPVARAQALSLAHHCLLGPDHGPLRRSLAVELIGESVRTARRGDLLIGLLWLTVDLLLDAEPHAERRLAELRDLLDEHGHLAVGFVVSAIEVMLTVRAGHLERAEVLARGCAERAAAAGDTDATGWLGAQLVAIRWYQGRLPELLPMLGEMTHSPTLSAVDYSPLAALAMAAAVAGDHRTAAGALARLCGRDLAGLPRSSTWLVTLNGIVETAYLLGDDRAAARAYELLSPYADLPMVAGLGVACFGSVQHALGVASLTTGHLDRAVAHLAAAVRHNLAIAHWPAVVTSRVRHAHALTRRAHPGDDAAAQRELATAADEATALGIPLPGGPRAGGENSPTAVCGRQGKSWRIEWGARNAVVESGIGVLHLAVLLANPGREIPAIDLAAGVAALAGTAAASVSTQPILDPAATRQYRRRLSQLEAEPGDRAELDWLVAELAGARAIGGRARRFADNSERARLAVGKAIRRALVRIEEADPLIGAHLRSSVHTGVRCSYRPA